MLKNITKRLFTIGSKWKSPEFDKTAFQKQFDGLKPPQSEFFDK